MANPKQTWAQDPETGGGAQGNPTHGDSNSSQYADTNRFGKPQTGDTAPILTPQNKVSDPVWGVNGYAGGGTPAAPEVPVTKGE